MEFTVQEARNLLGSDDALILEIGSNDGTDTEQFLHSFPNGRIHCFECEPRAIAKWQNKVTDPRASLYTIALAEFEGVRTFHQSAGTPPGKCWDGYGDQWDMSGSLLPVNRHIEYGTWLRFDTTVDVQCVTLDQWASQHIPKSIIDFVWIDVQGAEGMVLRGGLETIKRIKWWYCEIDPRELYHGMATFDEVRSLLPGFSLAKKYSGFNYLWSNDAIA